MTSLPPNTCPAINSVIGILDRLSELDGVDGRDIGNAKDLLEEIRSANADLRELAENAELLRGAMEDIAGAPKWDIWKDCREDAADDMVSIAKKALRECAK